MTISLLGDIKAEVTPDVGSANVLGLNSESKRDEGSNDKEAGRNLSTKAWEEWKKKGEGSSRPPWWLLLLGLIALSLAYWLWGRGPAVVL
jgi:hypothetical protein